MPWLRAGDNAATHPLVMALATVAASDDRTMNEVFGFVVRCAMQSAGHMTDYRIDAGTAQTVGGSRWKKLLRQAVEAELVTEHGKGRDRHWQLIQDDEFLHIRLKNDVVWERSRDKDRRNARLTLPVRLRDGDECRYCARVVQWGDNKSGRGGTYDHRKPGTPATTPEDLVVACRQCNGRRGNDPKADERVPVLPVPVPPYYAAKTVEMLEGNGLMIPKNARRTAGEARPGPTGPGAPARPGAAAAAPDTACTTARPSTPTGSGIPRSQARPGEPRSGSRSTPSTVAARPGDSSDTACTTARPDIGADTACSTLRPDGSSPTDTAAPQERPGLAPTPDTASSSRGNDPPPPGPDRASPTDPVSINVDQSEDWIPGRVGSGRSGSGLEGPGRVGRQPAVRQVGDLPGLPSGEQSSSARQRSRRGRRARR